MESSIAVSLPSMDEWEVPIDCHACHGTYAVAFRHLRTGNVLRCPFCTATYIVTTTMHGNVSRASETFHRRWIEEFEALSARRRRELNEFEERKRDSGARAFNEQLKSISQSVKPPGARARGSSASRRRFRAVLQRVQHERGRASGLAGNQGFLLRTLLDPTAAGCPALNGGGPAAPSGAGPAAPNGGGPAAPSGAGPAAPSGAGPAALFDDGPTMRCLGLRGTNWGSRHA
jgi:hypothetical protein